MYDKDNRIYYTAFTWSQWIEECQRNADPKASTIDQNQQNMLDYRTSDWNGRATYGEAVDFARLGWPEGAKLAEAALANAARHVIRFTAPTTHFDVAGEEPDIARYLSGSPDCMTYQGEEQSRSRPVLRIMIEGWNSAYVTGEQMQRRGAAILAHVDAIEAAEIRCEIILRFASKNPDGRAKSFSGMVTDVTLKEAGEHFDLDRCAFAMVHPASLRRLHFRQMETIEAPYSRWMSDGHGHPSERHQRNYRLGEYTGSIVIPSANEHVSDFNDAATANTRVASYLLEGITRLGHDMRCDGLAEMLRENLNKKAA